MLGRFCLVLQMPQKIWPSSDLPEVSRKLMTVLSENQFASLSPPFTRPKCSLSEAFKDKPSRCSASFLTTRWLQPFGQCVTYVSSAAGLAFLHPLLNVWPRIFCFPHSSVGLASEEQCWLSGGHFQDTATAGVLLRIPKWRSLEWKKPSGMRSVDLSYGFFRSPVLILCKSSSFFCTQNLRIFSSSVLLGKLNTSVITISECLSQPPYIS